MKHERIGYKLGLGIVAILTLPFALFVAVMSIILAICTIPCATVALVGGATTAYSVLNKGIVIATKGMLLANKLIKRARHNTNNGNEIYAQAKRDGEI